MLVLGGAYVCWSAVLLIHWCFVLSPLLPFQCSPLFHCFSQLTACFLSACPAMAQKEWLQNWLRETIQETRSLNHHWQTQGLFLIILINHGVFIAYFPKQLAKSLHGSLTNKSFSSNFFCGLLGLSALAFKPKQWRPDPWLFGPINTSWMCSCKKYWGNFLVVTWMFPMLWKL